MNITKQTDMTFNMDNLQVNIQKLETAAKNLDYFLYKDNLAPSLLHLMNITPQSGSTASGLSDQDYLSSLLASVNNMPQIKLNKTVPVPLEIMDQCGNVQCHCMMGLFPEISRAWLTVDSDIYVWTYEENTDIAYFDALNETILCVGLVNPKPGVFHNFIKHLLVLVTSVDIIVLGVTFGEKDLFSEIQLIPEPVFTLPTDGVVVSTILGTEMGRIFLGSKEGNLFEIYYQAESGWFGKRCKKVNLSINPLSFLVPSFLNAVLGEEDAIVQISVDNSRNILYILTEKGAIEVCDLGEKGNCFSRIIKLSQSNLVQQAMNAVKTLDSQNFRPIVSISAVEASESSYINLVAVTQTGIRLYLSTANVNNQQPNQRPYTLCLQHVRLPPGYSANINVRPRAVHNAHYRDRNLLLVSTVNDKDILWCISSDLFPFSSSLVEGYTMANLDSVVIAMAEVKQVQKFHNPVEELAPLVIRQHYEPPKKYVVLTSQGVHIFVKLRPVDILKHLLLDSRGADSESVKNFFIIETEDQACATSLILASLESEQNVELADYATRAFFIYGGEPKMPVSNNLAQNQMSMSRSFNPNVISTPAPYHSQAMQQSFLPNMSSNMLSNSSMQNLTSDINSIFQFSSKHNGLYLYFGRILKPIWNKKCVEKYAVPPNSFTATSSITGDDCFLIINNLTALHNFLLLNTQLCACSPSLSITQQQNVTMAGPKYTIQDAQLEERRSLDSLKSFVCHCCQIVSLWKILCEHQFHTLIGLLPDQDQERLQALTFKDLFLYGQDICSMLIGALINNYLQDNASVDLINSKLREICPSFYKTEDAAFSKASEMLRTCVTSQSNNEKEDLITGALELCKSIVPKIGMHEICMQFVSLKAYRAVIDLCYTCGKRIDPENMATRFYKNNNDTDEEGYSCYVKRTEIYQEIVHMLDAINQISNTNVGSSSKTAGQSVQDSSNDLVKKVIQEILACDDDIMHTVVYGWMISKNMNNDLIKINNESLEMFLTRNSEHTSDVKVMDLLWKYYESNKNHLEAAKILSKLASLQGNSINLKERLSYIARAIMCLGNNTGYAPCLGVFYRDLEDKLDVGRVQDEILNCLTNLNGDNNPAVGQAILSLNSGLYQISQLYENFADPFDLWECKLSIINCAGYSDRHLVETIWKNIIKNELKNSLHYTNPNDRLNQVLTKVKQLSRLYGNSVTCFPLEYIVLELEIISVTLRASKSIVPKALFLMALPMEKLITVYGSLLKITSNDTFWKTEEHEFHLAESIAALITCFLEDSGRYDNVSKRKTISLCQDAVSELLSNLYSKPNTSDLINVLRNIQTKLTRI